MSEYDYDLFVIGGGSGGVRACRIAASLGARVACAEERYFGGTCVNVGCVPKKLFSYAAHYREDFEDSLGFGWKISTPSFDWHTLKTNKDKEISRLEGIYNSILENNKVAIFKHRATVSGPHELLVNGSKITARYILLAVGGWPWVPDFEGSELAVTSNDMFELEKLPESMVVIGGGYIAVEFASIFARFGTDVTLVYRGEALLRGFDEEIRQFISAEIGRYIDLRLETSPAMIVRKNNRLVTVFNDGSEVESEIVLGATGRRPLTANLGLENVNVELSETGAVIVNNSFQTGEPSIYAVGDVIDRVALTPVALAEGQLVARALFSGDVREMDYNNIPTAVFCQPNLGTVGLTEQQALDKGMEIDVYSAKVRQLKHTLSGREEFSLLKLLVDSSSDRVIGAHMVGPEAGELMQGIAVAMNCGATKADFDRTLGIHPTLAEEFVTMRTKRKSHKATN
ncbi:MAG: glutathione-disulfide reductase [Gammaproteobacteria bacterium]|nr:glutathione-disulfide reductase [Gammaproteobacteria bacterium]